MTGPALYLALARRRLGELGEWLDDHRRPPRVVAWGGRPGIDFQVGSPRDLRRAARQRQMADLQRAGELMTQAFADLGTQVTEAFRPIARLTGTLERVDEDTILARWARRRVR